MESSVPGEYNNWGHKKVSWRHLDIKNNFHSMNGYVTSPVHFLALLLQHINYFKNSSWLQYSIRFACCTHLGCYTHSILAAVLYTLPQIPFIVLNNLTRIQELTLYLNHAGLTVSLSMWSSDHDHIGKKLMLYNYRMIFFILIIFR